MTNKEDEQLLQDASTLLMFANAAARQEQKPPSEPPTTIPTPKAVPVGLTELPQPMYGYPYQYTVLPSPNIPKLSPHRASLDSIMNSDVPEPRIEPKPEPVEVELSRTHTRESAESRPEKRPEPKPSRSSISALINAEPDEAPQPVPVPVPVKTEVKIEPAEKKVSPPLKSPSTAKIPVSPHKASPALDRGINLTTGERNNNNAMIAAAALAAAADIPLPLKVSHKGDETEDEGEKKPKKKPTRRKRDEEETKKPRKKRDTGKNSDIDQPDSDKHTQDTMDTSNTDSQDQNTLQTSPVLGTKELGPSFEYKEEEKTEEKEKEEAKEDEKENEKELGMESSKDSGSLSPKSHGPQTPQQHETPSQESKDKDNDSMLDSVIPPLESYQVDPDSGLIGCICGIEDDDGFTIQCDVCFRWQHCLCMGFMTSDEVPEAEYQCYYCDQKKWNKFNPDVCRRQTLDRLDPTKSDGEAAKRKRSSSGKTEKRRKMEFRKEPTAEPPEEKLPNKDNELLHEGVTAESYQSVYFHLKSNDYKRPSVKRYFEQWGDWFRETKDVKGILTLSQAAFKAQRLSNVIRPNFSKYLSEHNVLQKKKGNGTSVQVKPYADNQKQKFNGISKLALFLSAPGSESFTVPPNTYVIEYLGEANLFREFVEDRTNQYATWGATKPRVMSTSLPTANGHQDIVLDSRFVGNESRFIRKSCPMAANCRIQPVYVPETNTVHFMVVTTQEIVLKDDQEEELRLAWDWDPKHPIHKLYANNCSEKFESLSSSDKSALISCVDNILHFTECGCSTSSTSTSCAILKVKRATSYLLRSTRKVSSISNVNLVKSKEELILPKKEREYVPWSQRFSERDQLIQMDLLVCDKTPQVTESFEPPTKATVLFKVPYKNQLEARQKEFQKKVAQKQDPEENTQNYDMFPVVSGVVIQIEESVAKEEKEEEEDKVSVAEPSAVSPEPEVRADAPKIVKKLSFADYKKKMK